MKIFIATKNQKKLCELERILIPMGFEVLSEKDLSETFPDVEENGTTFAENAIIKAKTVYDIVKIPVVPEGYTSSWAQYTILLEDKAERDGLKNYLADKGIPSMVYYQKMMRHQTAMEKHLAFQPFDSFDPDRLCDRCLSLPIGPYITTDEQDEVICAIKEFLTAQV